VKKKSPPYAILGAIAVGIIGIFLLFRWKQGMEAANAAALKTQQDQLQAEIDELKSKPQTVVSTTDTNMRKVYYATQPISAGAKISPAFYQTKLTPNDVLPEAYGEGADIVGFYAIRPIEKGDPLTPHNVGKTLPYLAERIPPGMRAMALPIFDSVNTGSEGNATGGFAVDGDFVDLLFTLAVDNPQGGDKLLVNTQTILQNVQVLFIPQTQTRSDTTVGIMPVQPVSVTFMVTPEEAQMLLYFEHMKEGKFSMILRGRNDKDVTKLKPYAITDINDFRKVQKKTDQSYDRVAQLQKEIEAEEQKEKAQASQGSTNETTAPTPPSP
jgi:Flp pilus assembly protein CpaB